MAAIIDSRAVVAKLTGSEKVYLLFGGHPMPLPKANDLRAAAAKEKQAEVGRQVQHLVNLRKDTGHATVCVWLHMGRVLSSDDQIVRDAWLAAAQAWAKSQAKSGYKITVTASARLGDEGVFVDVRW